MTVATGTDPVRPVPATRPPAVGWLAAGFAGCAVVALAVALRAPLVVTVLGLVLFGVLHTVLELRYVAGRFGGVLRGRLLVVLLALITGIVLARLAGARTLEIFVAYGVLAAGACAAFRGVWSRIAALSMLGVAGAVSLAWPAYHFVVLAHLHNVVPLFFLWDWSRRLPAGRRLFRATQLGWVLAIPALVLLGVLDGWIVGGPSAVAAFAGPAVGFASSPATIAAPVVPPDVAIGARFLVVFAYLQTMHYAVWVGFLPRAAPDATAAFEARVPWLRGPRTWAFALVGALAVGALLVADYAQGRTVYAALASYHAYLEFPVLLWMLAARRPFAGMVKMGTSPP